MQKPRAIFLLFLLISFIDSSTAWSGQGQSFFGKGKSPTESLEERVASYRDSDARNQEISASIASDTFPTDLLSIILEYARDPSFQIVANEHGLVAMLNGLLYHVPFPEEGAPALENPSQIRSLVPFEFEKEEKKSEPSTDLTDSKNINEVKAAPPKRSGLTFCRDLNTPVSSWHTLGPSPSSDATQEEKKRPQPQFNQIEISDLDIGIAVTTQGELYTWGDSSLVSEFIRSEPLQENSESLSQPSSQPKQPKPSPYKIAFHSQHLNLVLYSEDGTIYRWDWLRQHHLDSKQQKTRRLFNAALAACGPVPGARYSFFYGTLPLYRPVFDLEGKKIKCIDLSSIMSVFAATEREVYGWGYLFYRNSAEVTSLHYDRPHLIQYQDEKKSSDFEIIKMKVFKRYEKPSVFIISGDGRVCVYGDHSDHQLGVKPYSRRGSQTRTAFELLEFPENERILDIQGTTSNHPISLYARSQSGLIWTWAGPSKIKTPCRVQLPNNERVTDLIARHKSCLVATEHGNLYYHYYGGASMIAHWMKMNSKPYGDFQIAQIGIAPVLKDYADAKFILYWVLRNGMIFIIPKIMTSSDIPGTSEPVLLFSLIQ